MQKTETTQVVIVTENFRIEGAINLYPGGRLTDYMNKAEHFIAVMDARVTDHGGKELKLTSDSFLNINLSKIEMIMPVNNID